MENVFVEAQDGAGADIDVKIEVKNYPKKDNVFLTKTVTLRAQDGFQTLTDIEIPADKGFFSIDPLEKQYVFLQAEFPGKIILEKVVMLSFQSGYIFVQTDKPIYTPSTTVQYRAFTVTPNLHPLSGTPITVEIMNPQGITIQSETIFPQNGMKSGKYKIPEVSSHGIWKVIARYTNTPQKKFTADFEVKEYVLPTFEVKLKPRKSFYYVGDEQLMVDIEARYLFGQEVEGNAFVLFGVIDGEKKTSISTSLQKVPILEGKGTAQLSKEMFEKSFKHFDINDIVGQSIYISVSVLTETGSEMVEAERRGIKIVTSPYTIHFKRTPHFYKPGMPFDVSVYVTNPDETPADRVLVEVNPGGVKGQTLANGIAKVTAKTTDPELSDTEQAVNKMTAHAFVPKEGSNNFLHVAIDSAELEMGDQMKVNLNTGNSPGAKNQDYTYLVLSKGQIVVVGRFKRQGQALVTLSLPVTKDMVPSFRFVAYYHVGSKEVVSDSVWVDVKDTCMGKLELKVIEKEKNNVFNIGAKVHLQITGDPGARVGLVVVDKAVHVLNKKRLTQSKVWDVIEKHDTGCTAGGGRESMGVFTDAGLMFVSSTAGATNTRTVSQFSNGIRECCLDGMRDSPLGYTCDRRSKYITDGSKCVEAFLLCCNKFLEHKDEITEEEELLLARGDEEEDLYTDSEDITSRTQFPESWLWEEIDLTAAVTKKVMYLKDSITTWQVMGICVAEPEELIVFKDFFIDLKMPYSVVRGEQVEIKAVLYNYLQDDLRVRVEFLESPDVCSLASKKKKYRSTVTVKAGTSSSVPYVIIPMTLGNHDLEVKAAGLNIARVDGVRKTLKVVSEGVLIALQRENVELNPVKNGEKPIIVKADLPKDQVPGTSSSTHISITGEEVIQTAEQAISGNFMGRLIVQPHGCGEQTMIFMTLPLIATHYLDSTNQWDAIGIEKRVDAIAHINTGYQRELTFRKSDGSYAAWLHAPSSTWLTAYVAKVFSLANELISIDEDVVCSALKWLVINKQMPDGSFKEDAPVYHAEMVGDIRGKDAESSLTAFITVAMQEGREICGAKVGSLHDSIRKAVSFLEDRLSKLKNPYAVALASYAMANENSLNRDVLLHHSTLGQEGRFWEVPGSHHASLEATAYSVLALVKDKDFERAGEAVHWMGRQNSQYGAWGTTQSTIMVFQAVAEYRMQVKDEQNFNLLVELGVQGRGNPKVYTIKRDNMHLTRSDEVEINKDFNVLTLYYARPVEKKSDCTSFNLSINIEKLVAEEGVLETYQLTLDFFYKNETRDATMTVLDISIPTGFSVNNKDLIRLSTGKERYIQKFEMDKQLSERGSLILYLDKVSHKEIDRIIFRINKEFPVSLLQPAAVTIYEYYSPNARCTKYFHPQREAAIYRLCRGEMCQCAEENCTFQGKHKVKEGERMVDKACESGMDFVNLQEVVYGHDSDNYHMKVEKVLKEGTDEDVQNGVRSFLARTSCREALGLVKGKSYLVMGKSVDLPEIEGSLQYILGEQTWIEYWPTKEERSQYQERYDDISKLEKDLLDSGCAL
ncbi:hypothetical protein DNTS_017222 [Danionella cerebrum]|uniref:Uncharacterized protein n=1 Tax=Danionella cerebrum TaxID=2873325 RepID=A0A553QBR0_9TELE|nr:hypothetical protein DNTS_017222 [Danionella translucida]